MASPKRRIWLLRAVAFAVVGFFAFGALASLL